MAKRFTEQRLGSIISGPGHSQHHSHTGRKTLLGPESDQRASQRGCSESANSRDWSDPGLVGVMVQVALERYVEGTTQPGVADRSNGRQILDGLGRQGHPVDGSSTCL